MARTSVRATGSGALEVLRKVASSYLFRRLIKALVTIFVMASLTFFLIRLMPGGPVEAYIANLVTQYNVSHQSAVQQAGGDLILAEGFLDLVKGHARPNASLRDGLLSAAMCLAARESARTKTFQPV